MKNILKFKKKTSLKKDIIITVFVAIIAGAVIGTFLPETNEAPLGITGASQATNGSSSIQGDIIGIAMVTDGDTIRINDTRIRFHGIDAPESNQTCLYADGSTWNCGEASTSYLKSIVAGRSLLCEQKDVDRYGRIVAVCSVDRNDLNAMMVDSGMALAYRTYSNDYVDNEASAKSSSKGMWGGKFIEPWKWRTGTRLTTQVNTGDCNIKGNISSKGEKIYHVPGARYYVNTIINENKDRLAFNNQMPNLVDKGLIAGKDRFYWTIKNEKPIT